MGRKWMLLPALLLGANAAAEEPAVLTLEAALSRARSHNREVAAAVLEVARAEDQVAAAKARRWPSLSADVLASHLLTPLELTFEKGVFGEYPGTGPIPGTDTVISTPRRLTTLASGSLTQPLSQLYRINLAVDARKLSVLAANEDLRAERAEIAGAVRAAYYGGLRAQASLAVAEENLALSREVERLTKEAVSRETALPGDLLDAKARRVRAEADVLTLRDALRTQKELLSSYLAQDLGTDFALASVPEALPEEPSLADARRDVREQRPAVRKARLGAGIAAIDTKIASAALYPDLSLSVNYLSFHGTSVLPKNVLSAGVSFSWEVFDGGRRKSELREKQRAAEQAALRARQAEEAAAVEVARDVRRLDENLRLLEAARLSREAAAEKVRVSKNRYDAGASLLSELLRAQTTLADASQDESEALLSYWTARADYEKSLGVDL